MKFQTLHLRNFQSHPDTLVELSPGINAFVGASDQGKTTMLRALNWLANNNPTGDSIVSDWARDDSGIKEECSVAVQTDAGNTIRRIKAQKRNGYDLDGDKYDAIRTSVPSQVTDALNLEVVNWQRQMDPPFLLAESGGARARFFNQLIRLEEVDQCLSVAESLRRKVNGTIQPLQDEVLAGKEQLLSLEWTEGLGGELNRLEAFLAEKEAVQLKQEKLRELIRQGEEADRLVTTLSAPILLAQHQVRQVREKHGEILVASRQINNLRPLIKGLTDAEQKLTQTEQAPALVEQVGQIKTFADKVKDMRGQIERLASLRSGLLHADKVLEYPVPPDIGEKVARVRKYAETHKITQEKRKVLNRLAVSLFEATHEIETSTTQIETIKSQLPDVCPLCKGTGSPKAHHHG